MKHVEEINLPCAICESNKNENYVLLYRLGDCDIIKCKSCGLVYVNSLFEEIKRASGKVYASEVYEQIGKTLLKRFSTDIVKIETLTKKGKILDIGCGYGYFLTIAKQRGWQCTGVEINEELASYLNTKKGLNVRAGTLSEQNYETESFDVITMFNIIEHLLYPAKAMAEVNRILKKEGLLVVETPTEDGLFKKIASLLYKVSAGKVSFMIKGAYQKGGHHFGFSRQSIRKILEKNGFQVISIEGRMSPFDEFLKKEILKASLPVKVVKLIAIPSLWALSRIVSMENRMVVYARKK
jgi:2-polyprenyl-3-methyl-5-hydroxy-6-metoxy-1,4-benzoquinol methylase